jgi:large repetitive protein
MSSTLRSGLQSQVDKPIIYSGEEVKYTYAIRNLGDVPLTEISLSDDTGLVPIYVSGDDGDGVLQNKEIWIYEGKANPIDDIINTGNASGKDPTDRFVYNESKAKVDVIHPGIRLVKTVNKPIIYSGENVKYTYAISNTGDVNLTLIRVNDDTGLVPALISGDDGDGVLELTETWTYEANSNPLDDITNIGNATGRDATNRDVFDADDAHVDVIHPGINLVKTIDKPIIYSGEAVKYTYQVKNIGDVNLTDITVTDNMGLIPTLVAGDDGDKVLELSETWVYEAFSSLTSDTINIGNATGRDITNREVFDTDDASADIIHPGIGLQKLVDKPIIYSGEAVRYTYRVSNTGDVALANIRVTDNTGLVPAYVSGDDGDGMLELSEVWIFEGTASLTSDTTNIGNATGRDPSNRDVFNISTAHVDVIHPGIKLIKTVDRPIIYSGERVNYTYQVSNAGDVNLTEIRVTDNTGIMPVYISGDNGDGMLGLSETWVYRASANPTSDVTNIGNATGRDITGRSVFSLSTAQVDVIRPGIKLIKRADKPIIYSGEIVNYTYLVNNTGDVALADIRITDDTGLIPVLVSGDDGDGILELSETWTYKGIANPVTDITNIGMAIGRDVTGRDVSSTDDAHVDVIHPAISLVKTVDKPTIYSGEAVKYTYRVNNTGDVALSNIRVTDNAGLVPTLVSGDDGDGVLDLAETWIYQASSNPRSDITNIGNVTGRDSIGRDVFDMDDAHVDVIHPMIELVKAVDREVIYRGEKVIYTYTVKNKGDSDLAAIRVADDTGLIPILVSGDDGYGVLGPGETWVYQANANPTADVTNIGKATGTDASGRDVSSTDDAHVDVIHPGIRLVKAADRQIVAIGEMVIYTYNVTLEGDVNLTDVSVTDDQGLVPVLDGGDDGDGVLESGETWVYTANSSLNVDTTNIGNATGKDPSNRFVFSRDDAYVNVIMPEIRLVKTPDNSSVRIGEKVTYTYLVTNLGDFPLVVSISDDKIPHISGPVLGGDLNHNDALDPGETWAFTASANLYSDTVNTAVANGSYPGGEVSDVDTASVDVINPAISIYKSVDRPVTHTGERVTYAYRVGLSGDVNLTDIRVSDNQTGVSPAFTGGDDGDGILESGETWSFHALANPTSDVTNLGTARGRDPTGRDVFNSSTAHVDVIYPGINLVKTIDKPDIYSGEVVRYTYNVTLNGDVNLTNVGVTDDQGLIPVLDDGDDGDGVLEPGETWSFHALAHPAQDVTNIGNASGRDELGMEVYSSDDARVNVIHPGISLVKSADKSMIYSGERVNYTYSVSLNGDVNLTDVRVTDDQGLVPAFASGDDGDGVLEPGETWVFRASASPSSDVTNIGTALARDPLGRDVRASGTSTVSVLIPSIQVAKQASPMEGEKGTEVAFTILANNTGGVDLKPMTVTDILPAGMVYVPGSTNMCLEAQIQRHTMWCITQTGLPS